MTMAIIGERTIDGAARTTVDTGLSAREFAKARLHDSLAEQGYALAFDGTITRWQVTGTTCVAEGTKDESMLAYGPAFDGTTLLSVITGDDVEAAWSAFHRFTSFFERVASYGEVGREARNAALANGPGGILASPEGGFLVLPTRLYDRSLVARGADAVRRGKLLWTYPDEDRDESRRFGFMAGTLAYRVITGKPPFDAESLSRHDAEEAAGEIARLMRSADFIPAGLENASVRKPAADCVNALVNCTLAASLDTLLAFGDDYRSVLDPARHGGGASPEASRTRAKVAQARAYRAKRAEFFRKHGRTLAISFVAAAALTAFAVSWARGAASRPSTKGMSPREVVEGYYRAIGSLDTVRIDAFGTRNAGNDYDTLASTLFVSTKMRLNYESKATLVSPEVLAEGGAKKGQTVFGITGLVIEETETESEAEAEAEAEAEEFRTSLYLWVPSLESGNGDAGWTADDAEEPLTIYRHRDTVRLTRDDGRWLVDRVTPEERAEVIAGTGAIVEALSSADLPPWAPTP